MPKVGKHVTKYQGGYIETDINFGSPSRSRVKNENKNFWMKLPEAVKRFNNEIEFVYGKDIESTTSQFDEVVQNYYKQSKKIKKVIGYKFESQHFLSKAPKEHTDDIRSRSFRFNDWFCLQTEKHHWPEQEMKLQYVVGFMVTVGEKNFFSDNEKSVGKPIDKGSHWNEFIGYKFIDWSQEREDWFSNTYLGFSNLIQKCRAFFKQDEEKFIQAILQTNLLNNNK